MQNYVTHLEINDLKCFKGKHEVNFADDKGTFCKWNIVVGNNGAGKSTVLGCVGIGSAFFNDKYIDELVEAAHAHPDEMVGRKIHTPMGHVLYQEFFSPSDNLKASFQVNLGTSSIRCSRNREMRFDFDSGHRSPPIFTYGSNRTPQRGTEWTADRDVFNQNLIDGQSRIASPMDWLEDLHRLDLSSRKTKFSRHKKAVIETLINVLPDVDDILFPEPEDFDSPSVLFSTPYGKVPPDRLSGGYQTLMGWLVDLTRRMFEAYPKSKDPLSQPAVVIVDEIDLHLNPSWQVQLIDYLDERFKKTQFIVSAHSPLIVQSHPSANIILLERQGDCAVVRQDIGHIQHWRLDQILSSDLFGRTPLASPLEKDLVAEHSKLIAKPKRSKSEEKRLKEVIREMEVKLPVGQTHEDRELHALLGSYLSGLKSNGANAEKTSKASAK